jgi:hypothetical protein
MRLKIKDEQAEEVVVTLALRKVGGRVTVSQVDIDSDGKYHRDIVSLGEDGTIFIYNHRNAQRAGFKRLLFSNSVIARQPQLTSVELGE